jgi:hypothetical protein
MPIPSNKELYEQVKKEVYHKYPKHSAYRSGLLVQEYKRRGGTYEGNKSINNGLPLWFASKWSNQRGEVGYRYLSDIYRPTVRVTKDTPTTFAELTAEEIAKARREKARTGRVKQFKESNKK